jgi:medium-chain acyl-[acyl-carrier-protein] hydrolase
MPEPALPAKPWTLFARRLDEPRVRLLCFPFAGGGASAFRTWGRALAGDGIEVWPVQLPGRENRTAEPPFQDLAELTGRMVDEFAPLLGDVPYALFGHSFGARLSFEFAQEMRRRAQPAPVQLFASAHRPPHVPEREPPVHSLPHHKLIRKLLQYGGTSPAVFADPDLLALVMTPLMADLRMFEGRPWTPVPPLECPITGLHGTDDTSVYPEEVQRWAELTHARFHLRSITGPHLFVVSSASAVQAIVRDDLTTTVPGGRLS